MSKPNIYRDQLGPPPDHRPANRRAPRQPRTWVTQTNRGNNTKNDLKVCTYNVRTLNDGNLEILMKELEKIKWEIIGMSETKMIDEQIIRTDNGHYLYNSGNTKQKRNGVGFIVHKSLQNKVIEFKPISERLAVIKLKQKRNKIVLIQAYFPTSDYSDTEVESLYEDLQNIIDTTPKRDNLIILGDFNAKIGSLHTSHYSAVGKFTKGKSNTRGIMLADFCIRNQLKITNTFFKKRRLHTWTSPNGLIRNQIDFILVKERDMKLIKDSSVINNPDISDHRMVRMTFKTNMISYERPKNPRYQINSLKDPETRRKFQIELENKFKLLEVQDENNSDNMLNVIENAVKDSLSKVIPKSLPIKPSWMTKNTEMMIEQKRKIRTTKGENSKDYKIIKAEVKKMVKKDKLTEIDNECTKLSKLPQNQKYYQIIKKLKNNKPKQIGWGIRRADGSVTRDREEIINEWVKFYENLYYDTPDNNEIIINENEPSIPPFILSEVENSLKQAKMGKSPGIDGIHTETLKAGGEIIAKACLKLFNEILRTNEIPENFKKAEIVLIHKKGDRRECKNYRPISLLNHTYKVFMLTLANRIKKDLYSFFPSSQAAYQPGRTTIEQIICTEQIIEKALEFNKPVYATFIDFTKAFDSVKLPALWDALSRTPINKNYIKLLKETYKGSKSKIRTDVGYSRFIDILKGVKQGDILSAILFCVLLAAILYDIEGNYGYPIAGHQISNFGYADDLALIDDNFERLQEFINKFCETAEKAGLSINVSKTQAFTTAETTPEIKIKGNIIAHVDNFNYLGHTINNKNDHNPAIDNRIAKGWAAVNKNEILLKSNRIPINIKTKIYKTFIMPIVLYGCECITWNKNLLRKMEVFQNKILRIITNVNIKDHVPIDFLRSKTKINAIEQEIKSRKLRLFGHLKRQETGLAKICIEGNINGKRQRGKPKRRWRDDIREWTNMNWGEINNATRNRSIWRRIVKSQSATGGKCVK